MLLKWQRNFRKVCIRALFVAQETNFYPHLFHLVTAGLANVITFAYLGRVHMSLYTIGCTASAATTLQIPQLLKMCMDFLLAELNVQTCVYIWNIAAAYGLLPVRDAARRFVLENFVQFADTPLFTQLTLEQISAFLQDDSLLLPSEVTAFQVRGQRLIFIAEIAGWISVCQKAFSVNRLHQ